MKKNNLLTKKHAKSISLALLLIFISCVLSCIREKEGFSDDPDSKALFKAKFYNSNANSKLIDPFGTDKTVSWEPQWDKMTKEYRDTAIYFFVPLNPVIRVKATNKKEEMEVRQIGFKRFLLGIQSKEGFNISSLRYINEDSTHINQYRNQMLNFFSIFPENYW